MLKKKTKSLDSQFLVRVIKEEVSPEEKEYFHTWLSESNQNKEEFGNLALLWDMADQSKVFEIPDNEVQWEEIQRKILLKSDQPPRFFSEQPPTSANLPQNNFHQHYQRKDHAWLFRAVAVLVVAVGLTLLLKTRDTELKLQSLKTIVEPNTLEYQLITQKGQRKTFTLSDGTIVYLNSDSRLTYPNFFSESTREVEIIGEAYFSVAADKKRPFLVRTGKMITKVTGTEFNVKHRMNKVSIVVSRGSVKTYSSNCDEVIDLVKGQMISYSETKGFSRPIRVNLNHYLAWRNNVFSFEHSTLKEVMDEIERYYNLEVVFVNSNAQDKVLTGVFDPESLDQTLTVISLTLDVTIDYKGNRITIK